MKRILALTTVAVLTLAAGSAFAHQDPNSEKKSERCDTWSRSGHDTKPGDSHEHTSGSDINDLEAVANTQYHGQSGHYVGRNDYGYVEVIGGQSYRGPDPAGHSFPGQGGTVQGEIDVASGVPDVDFNVAAFGPDLDHLPDAGNAAAWAQGSYAKVCISVANNKQEAESRTP